MNTFSVSPKKEKVMRLGKTGGAGALCGSGLGPMTEVLYIRPTYCRMQISVVGRKELCEGSNSPPLQIAGKLTKHRQGRPEGSVSAVAPEKYIK